MSSSEIPQEYRVVMLNHNRARVKFLREKLEEYLDRLNPKLRTWREHLIFEAGDSYKIALLEPLLRYGTMDPLNVRREIENLTRDDFSPVTFDNSLFVVDDYNRTGGKNLYKRVPSEIPNSSLPEGTTIHPVFVRRRQ